MTRKKRSANEAALAKTTHPSAAEPEAKAEARTPIPAWIDGPQFATDARVDGPADPQAKNWGDPYKALVSTASFEMGENRRFRQRVFMFKEKPDEQILATLKENGFTYRANEKAWTIQANPDTRRMSDELAREFAGQTQEMSR